MMHDQVWKVSDPVAASAPSGHWRESTFSRDDSAAMPRPGHSLAGVGVRQSVAPTLQAKLSISQPKDSAEVEADNMAATVMSMPDPGSVAARQEDDSVMPMRVQRKCTQCEKNTAELDKKDPPKDCESTDAQASSKEQVATMADEPDKEQVSTMPDEPDKEKEQEQVATKADEPDKEKVATSSQPGAAPQVTSGVESQIRSVQAGGAPLSQESRDFFEPRFGSDFSDVRVQTGAQASKVAGQLNAKAFTVGRNITFGENQYSPSSNAGKHLLAHELTHVVQQRGKRS